MHTGVHFLKALAFILVLAFGTCFVVGCDLGDFPVKGTFLDRSFDGSFLCPPDGERKPDFVSHFKLELLNRTVCQFLGEWQEIDGLFVGFYNNSIRTLYGSWHIESLKQFGGLAYQWDGRRLEGPWIEYPNHQGCDKMELVKVGVFPAQ